MQKFTNPLDNIKIAAPCSADWNEMYGDNRQRFCGQCKLNVYNLSDMTRPEAESFLINTEGRVCVKFYRRQDGTIITQNCPVGWQALKKRVSRVSVAAFSMIVGLFSGVFAFMQNSFDDVNLEKKVVVETNNVLNNQEDVILVEEGRLTYEKPNEIEEPVVGRIAEPDFVPKKYTHFVSKKHRR